MAIVVLTGVFAFLPRSWLGPTGQIASLVRIPFIPFGDFSEKMRGWLRPPPPAVRVEISKENIEILALERDRLRTQLLAAQSEVMRLESRIAELQEVKGAAGDVDFRPVIAETAANVAGRQPDSSAELVLLNKGTRDGVTVGTVAVDAGVNLIGTVSRVNRLTCDLRPLTSRASGLINARVYPADNEDAEYAEGVFVQLDPQGDGTFSAIVARGADVAEGDLVRLDDRSWPVTAQFMIVGTVHAVRARDGLVLRDEIVVRPRVTVHDVFNVTLKVDRVQLASEDTTP